MTGADIERRAIGNLTELSRWTPGLSVVDQGSRGSNVVIVRGLHTDALNGSEAAGNNYNNEVATYLGDIPLAVDLRPHDIERVEVLLGPQGTLYLPRRPDTRRRTLEVRGDLFALAHGGAGLGRGADFQPAGRRAQAGAARFRRPLRRSRIHRLRLPVAHAGGLRAGAGPERSRGGGGEPPARSRTRIPRTRCPRGSPCCGTRGRTCPRSSPTNCRTSGWARGRSTTRGRSTPGATSPRTATWSRTTARTSY